MIGSISRTVAALLGMPYIFPFGAKTPPAHLIPLVPTRPNVVVVRLIGSISRTVTALLGMPYIFPLGAKTPPIHFAISVPTLPNLAVVQLNVFVKSFIKAVI